MDLTTHKDDGSKGFDLLPVGLYNVSIQEVKYGKSKSSANMMFTVNYSIIEGPDGAADPKKSKNRKLFEHFVTTVDFHMGNLYTLCIVCGVPEAAIKAIDQNDNWKKLEGSVLKVRVSQEVRSDKKGEMTNKVEGGTYQSSAMKKEVPANISAAANAAPPNAQAELPFAN